ncbi:hypothetical protein CJU89_4406 [Yarrowia sp. B02]|nr:hypothetical protein CJU89_4406 [Yarrowia sp. B02]
MLNLHEDITYRDWAGYMMLAITKFGKVFMKMNLMNDAFLLITIMFMRVNVKAMDPTAYRAFKRTFSYKDVCVISREFSDSWGDYNKCYTEWRETMTPEEVLYISDMLTKYRVRDSHGDYNAFVNGPEKPLFNNEELEPWMLEFNKTKLYNIDDHIEYTARAYSLKTEFKNGKFVTPSELPENLGRLINLMQVTREFHFFKRILCDPEETMGGLFVHCCTDYANKHDPIIPKTGDEWVTWTAGGIPGDDPCLINDMELFVDEPTYEIGSLWVDGKDYRTTASGNVCYAYTHKGEPLLTPAVYCEKGINCLSNKCFTNIKDGFYRDAQLKIQLPKLKLTPELSWRGHAITNFDVSYWHKQLGHLNLKGIKKHISIIKGMPPLLWPFRIQCNECYPVVN